MHGQQNIKKPVDKVNLPDDVSVRTVTCCRM